jgi:hypothetical protein
MRRISVLWLLASILLVACASQPAPTPTREPTATPVEVLATKPEHLAGLWFSPRRAVVGPGLYHRFEADGTIRWEYSREELEEHPTNRGRFWFEDGVYYEEGDTCFPIGSYRAYLEIEGGRAVGLRFEEVDDSDPSCSERRLRRKDKCTRLDW